MSMKKLLPLVLITSLSAPAIAGENLMFGTNDKNSVSIYVAQSTGTHNIDKLVWPFKWEISPQTFIMATYAQPVEIFRLPGRINLNFMQNIAYESSNGLSFIGTGVSWDVSLLQSYGFYLGVGIGPYYRDNRDRWVSSRLFFGEKVFIGKRFSDHWRGELSTIHFSNGDFTEVNSGFNFVGFSINYSF